MSWTFCTSGAAVIKAGVCANSDIVISGAFLQEWSDEVEASICANTKKDWLTDYSGLKSTFKPILAELASDMIAMKIICYDTRGYGSLAASQTLLDVLTDNINRNLKTLSEYDKYSEVYK